MAPLEAATAREGQLQGTRIEPSGNFPGGTGRVRDKIVAFAGLSGRTVEKIQQVCEAARESPKRLTTPNPWLNVNRSVVF